MGTFGDDGATDEETGIARDAGCAGDPALRLTATAVRVPVFYGQAMAVNVTTRQKLDADAAKGLCAARGA